MVQNILQIVGFCRVRFTLTAPPTPMPNNGFAIVRLAHPPPKYKRTNQRQYKTENMLQFYPQETFKEIILEEKLQLRYAISSYGRLLSFTDNIEDGRFVKGSMQDGYRIWRYRFRDSSNKLCYKHRFLYKLVAEYFLPKTSGEQTYVLHLNYNRANDYVGNLKWSTYREMIEHREKSPFVIASRKKQLAAIREKRKHQGNKLTSTQVMFLKKRLFDPKRKTRLKILAKRFGVTTMTLQRIKTGENWGHIKI